MVREWADLNRARLVTQLRLTPLGEAETGRLVAHYFGEEPATQLRAPVYRMTRGNAFFLEEVLRRWRKWSHVTRGKQRVGTLSLRRHE